MICNIIFKIPNDSLDINKGNKKCDIIYNTNNFYECINEFDNLAFDELERLGGQNIKKIITYEQMIKEKPRGYFCVKNNNMFLIYYKEKNGWLYNSPPKLLKIFELLFCRIKRKIKIIYSDDYNERMEKEQSRIYNYEVLPQLKKKFDDNKNEPEKN